MTESPSTLDVKSSVHRDGEAPADVALALMIAWSEAEPHRAGEVALFEAENAAQILGRGEPGSGSSGLRAAFHRQRPGTTTRVAALQNPAISREQLRVTARGRRLHVERIGRCPALFRGEKIDRCTLAPGDTLQLKGQLLLLCIERPRTLAPLRDFPLTRVHPFGEPDAFGLLGESATMWQLRDSIAFQARAGAHALVLGPSGAGKELAARAIHLLSTRAAGPMIARNAATLPPGLVDAELFGNARNYPHAGMPERPGLIGAADGGTLFLDEIGELPAALHANLLRVLDGDGEYHRLGEAKARRANLRFIAATNRSPESLKHDLLARLPLRLSVPGLDERRDDIPLLVRHLLQRALEKSADLVGRFAGPSGEVRVSGDLVEHLIHRPYTTHVRELDGLLWRAMAASRGGEVELPLDMEQELFLGAGASDRPSASPPEEPLPPAAETRPITVKPAAPAPGDEITADQIRAAVAEHRGNLVKAAQALGLPSRYVLYRLLRKHGIDVRGLRGEDD